MRVERLTPALAPAWDAFVLAHPCGWVWHRSEWLTYGLALGGDREDLSFAVVDDADRIVGLCPLIREGDQYAFEGEPGAWPLVAPVDSGREIALTIGDELRRDGLRSRFRSCPLAAPPYCKEHEGLQPVGWYSRVVDLIRSEEELHADLRKSYKHLVNAGESSHEIVLDHAGSLAGHYQVVHAASVGRIAPRPHETYLLQQEWLRRRLSFLVGAYSRRSRRWEAFAYVFVYKGGAYYGSGPSVEPNVMHAVLWRAILEAQALGCSQFELGWQGHAKTEKERGIERFKAGFGGEDWPVWVMEVD